MPAAASLLLSEPFMPDPVFQRSAVLLCEHHPSEGSMGLILNQKTDLKIHEVLPALAESDFPVFSGGPVGHDTLHFIHRCPDRLSGGQDLGNGVIWGGNFEHLKILLKAGKIFTDEIKFFIGYAGWDPGQLNQEIAENSWIICKHYHPELIFGGQTENLWKEALHVMGPKYAHFANFPIDPRMN